MTKGEIIKEIIGSNGCETCKFKTECNHMERYIRTVTTDTICLCDVLKNDFEDFPNF